MEATKVSINREMDKEDMDIYGHTHTHTHKMEYYSNIKKWNSAICSNMDGPRVYYA